MIILFSCSFFLNFFQGYILKIFIRFLPVFIPNNSTKFFFLEFLFCNFLRVQGFKNSMIFSRISYRTPSRNYIGEFSSDSTQSSPQDCIRRSIFLSEIVSGILKVVFQEFRLEILEFFQRLLMEWRDSSRNSFRHYSQESF